MDAIPRLRPNPEIAEVSGIDTALILEMENQLGEAYDQGIFNSAEELRTGLGVLRETTQGGPLMAYMAAAKAEAIAAVASIVDIDPADTAKVIHIQMAIRQFHHLLDWMAKYISVAPRQETDDSFPEDS